MPNPLRERFVRLVSLLVGCCVCYGSSVLGGTLQPEPLHFTYPTSNNAVYQQRDEYFVGLLQLALRKSGEAFTLEALGLSPMSEKRSKLFLKSERYNVHWLLTSEEFESDLIPIRIPLYKGLIGWRLLVINELDAARFAKVTSPDSLKTMVATQGLGWPDSHILHHNNFSLRLAVDWPGLLEMMTKRNADFMPLALNEIWSVASTLDDKHLVVEDHLALHYPSAYYFFVSKTQANHARMLQEGLMKAVEDGSFDAFFMKTFGEAIRRSQLSRRKVLTLHNPLLPPLTPLDDKRLWYRLD